MSAAEPRDGFGLVGTTLDAKYRIDRVVAEGGFGVVYAGHHRALDVPIAVKVLKSMAELNEQERARFATLFVAEAQTIARIKHPHIVQVLDVGVAPAPTGDSVPWMVLEWLSGRTLQDELDARRREGARGRSPAEAMTLLRPVIEAVAHAHDEGVAHRDLKPSNIMLVEGRKGVSARVLDFGIAKMMNPGERVGSGSTLTHGTGNLFSPRYAAPEQVAGTRTGPWTDVHALALILVEVLTDASAYDASDKVELYARALASERPSLRARGIDAGALDFVLTRAMSLRADERYENAGAFLGALDEALSLGGETGADADDADEDGDDDEVRASERVAPRPAVPREVVAPRKRRSVVAAVAGLLAVMAGGVWLRASRRNEPVVEASSHRGTTDAGVTDVSATDVSATDVSATDVSATVVIATDVNATDAGAGGRAVGHRGGARRNTGPRRPPTDEDFLPR
jgi:eukaryotic-like serine/threonine-protein kinase